MVIGDDKECVHRYEPKIDLLEPGIDPNSVVGPPSLHPQMEVKCSACTGQQHASLKSEMGVCVYPTTSDS